LWRHFSPNRTRYALSVAKVSEIIATSPKSCDEAVTRGVGRAAGTIDGVASAWVKDQSVEVANGKVTAYRVSLKVTFVLKGKKNK
jgi:flavin-binding protein dodecin